MTDYAADRVTLDGSITASKRTGTAAADTVPAGALVLLTNGGAGSHNVDFTINYAWQGLNPGSAATPGKRRIAVAAGATLPVRIAPDQGDANGRVAMAIDGTATEVTYYVIGA